MALYKESLLYWIWLSQLTGIGPVTAKALLDALKTPENIYEACKEDLTYIHGIGNATAELILNSKSLYKAEDILNKCERSDIKILTYYDDLYKQEVRSIRNTPVLLYYRGNIREGSMGVAIVGSRRCNEYGKRITVEAAEFLAQNNITVVSGMAKGIDGYSHTACLKAGGYTMAILGCGLDICYPKEHDALMQKIIECGAVISEYPPGTKPSQRNFPERNRLISAWCRKLLVAEATENSGALITAAFAMEQKREVLAAPHSIYCEEGKGVNRLIERGAKIYLNPSQLIDNVGSQININNSSETSYRKILSTMEEIILEKIKEKPMSLNELLIVLQEDRQSVMETVSIMEIEGKILSAGGVLKAVI